MSWKWTEAQPHGMSLLAWLYADYNENLIVNVYNDSEAWLSIDGGAAIVLKFNSVEEAKREIEAALS